MKIQSSSIVMGSAHEENSYTYKESMTMEVAKSKNAVGAILTISKEAEGKSVKDAMVDYQTQQKEEAKKRQQESDQRALEKWQSIFAPIIRATIMRFHETIIWKSRCSRKCLRFCVERS